MTNKANGGAREATEQVPVLGAQLPFLSLCMICGDIGAKTIERALRSVLERSSGSMVDEVSVYWNGAPDRKPSCLFEPNGKPKAGWTTGGDAFIPFTITEGPWRSDFSWARNVSFSQAHGLWRFYLDADDIVSGAGDEEDETVIQEAIEAAGGNYEEASKGEGTTLAAFLTDLPPAVNAIWLPYNYVEIAGRAAQRIPRCRIVRWEDGWRWINPVHEDLVPISGNVARGAYLSGLIVRHRPVESADDRRDRNAEILLRLEAQAEDPAQLDHRTLYGIASVHYDHQNNVAAESYLRRAISVKPAPPPEDMFLYCTMLAQVLARMARFGDGMSLGMEAVMAQPHRPGGYLEIARCAYMNGAHGQAVYWFREGFKREEPIASLQQLPMAIFGQMRALGANALLAVGALDEALQWAQEAAKVDPGAFPAETLTMVQSAVDRDRMTKAFLVLAKEVVRIGDIRAAKALAAHCPAVISEDPPVREAVQGLRRMVEDEATQISAPEELDATTRKLLGIGPDETLIGSEILKHRDLDEVLSPAERGGGLVTVAVPDVSRPQPAVIGEGSVRALTAIRVHDLLSSRGVVQDLRVVHAEPHKIGDWRVVARYLPGPRACPPTVGIWCPHFAGYWGPDDPEYRGTGGSEEAVLYLSRAMAKRGYDVEVFAPLPPDDSPLRVDASVVWRPLDRFTPHRSFDHLLLHRAPWAVTLERFAAKHLWAWHHDHFYTEDTWSKQIVSRFRSLYVSRWQRAVLEGLVGRPTSGKVIYNGIPVEQFEVAERDESAAQRRPEVVAFSSMPTRGLDRLLEAWPQVVAEAPGAVLHCYYGMHTAKQLWRGTHKNIFAMLTRLEAMMARMGESVVSKGRMGQRALTAEFLRCGVMAYPANFPEVYMIAGVRALAAGMKFVATPTGCLRETMPGGLARFVDGALTDDEWKADGKERYVAALVQAITEPEDAYDRAEAMRKVRDIASWDRVAVRVDAAFKAAEAGDEAFFQSDVFDGAPGATVLGGDLRVSNDPQVQHGIEAEIPLFFAG